MVDFDTKGLCKLKMKALETFCAYYQRGGSENDSHFLNDLLKFPSAIKRMWDYDIAKSQKDEVR